MRNSLQRRAWIWVLQGVAIAGVLLPLMASAAVDGILIADLPGEPRAPRGWPLHVYWHSLSETPVGTSLVVKSSAGGEWSFPSISTGDWWLSPEQTQGIPAGPATMRVGGVELSLEFVSLPPPLSGAKLDERRLAVIRHALGTGQADEALREAEAWITLSPDTPTPRTLLGDALAALQRLPEAMAAYGAALERAEASARPPEALYPRINQVRYALLEQFPRQRVVPEEPEPQTLEEMDRVYGADPRGQWAVTATASSEYRTVGDYSASRATGAPDVTRYGDNGKAWASRLADGGLEWLDLTYSNAVHAIAVRVRQVYNPGAIIQVDLYDAAGAATTVFQGVDPQTYPASQIGWYVARFPRTPQPVQRVRLVLDSGRVQGWNEVDAVQLVAAPELPPPPPILVYSLEPGTGILRIADWPAGFILQRATQLDPADWQVHAYVPPVSAPVGDASAFFRLVQTP